jgi:Gram-negative bacterial TonB protein C-terminal/Secretion system C-terminal sorting domain
MKDGTIEDVVILRDPGAGMGEAAKQAVLKMNNMDQKWTPGRQRGQAVNVQYTVPIKFKLNDDSPKESLTALQKIPSKKPLIVLDGKALIQNGSDVLAKVDPKDIKSINVFKDEKEILKYTDNPGEFEGLIVVVTKNGAKQNQELSKKVLVKGKKIGTDVSLENAEYFINGVASNKQKIDAVNPSDILSVSILKETQNGKTIGKIMIQTKNPESSPNGLSIKAYPNPSPQDRINIAITSKNSKSPAVLKVYDINGKIIHSEAANISNGSANLEVNLSGKVVNAAQVIFIVEQGKEIQMTKVALN